MLILGLSAAIIAIVLMAALAATNGRRARNLRQARDQAIADGQRAYAQGHEDGLMDAYRRVDGQAATASSSYNQGYEAGVQAAHETATHRRNGQRTISA